MKPTTKRRLLIAAAVLVVLIAIPVGIFASAFIGLRSLEEREFGAVKLIKDGFVGVGVVDVGDGHIVLIDAGNDHEGKAILAELARRHLGPESVLAIFLTHGHGDHIGAAKLFPAAQVFVGFGDQGLAEGREGAHGPITKLFSPKPTGLHVTKELSDNTIVPIGNKQFRLFRVPGHTAGSAAYLVDGVLFLGDSAGSKKDGQLSPAPWAFSDDQAQNKQSLKQLASRLKATGSEVKYLVPAHSAALEGIQPLLDFAARN